MLRSYRDDPETQSFPNERRFASRASLRYVLEEATEHPDALVVAFSAVHEPHEAPRYYTTRVLRAVTCHRLFILDDHGPGAPLPRPSWYLGRDRADDVPATVDELMAAITDELGVDRERVFTCGASKGGWAALFFGARFGAGHAVAGEPQAFLGRHLLQEENLAIAAHVAGGTSAADGEWLDGLLFEAMRASAAPPQVHLYCGRDSPYHDRDVAPLMRFLGELGARADLTLGDHTHHVPELGLHFPGYLTATLASLLDR
jgi:hypothetical protein